VWLPAGRPAHFDGTSWDASATLPDAMRAIHGVAPGDLWMVGWSGSHKDERGAASHYDGKAWHETPVPAETPLLWAVHAAGAGEVYAVGDHGAAIAWGGAAWRPSATGVVGTLRAVYAPGGGVAFAAGKIGPYVLRRRRE
jgi:hypothetical protein